MVVVVVVVLVAVRCSALQRVAARCSVLQYVAVPQRSNRIVDVGKVFFLVVVLLLLPDLHASLLLALSLSLSLHGIGTSDIVGVSELEREVGFVRLLCIRQINSMRRMNMSNVFAEMDEYVQCVQRDG